MKWVRQNKITELFRSYFRASIEYDFGDDEPVFADAPHILCCHPHGLFSLSVFANLIFKPVVPLDYRVVTLAINFLVPFWRDALLSMGFVDGNRETVAELLQSGKSVAIVVGGAEEALDARPGTNDLTLGTRLGFVRLALEHGANLIPVFSFGENELFSQVMPNPPGSNLRAFQEWGKEMLGFSLPLASGRWGLPVPFRRQITTVVGRPLVVPKMPQPSMENILAVHGQYVQCLQELYDRHAPQMAPHVQDGLVIRDSRL